MIDDGGSPGLFSDDPDPAVVWADRQLLIPDDLFGSPPPELAGDGPASGPSDDAHMPEPDQIWAETAVESASHLAMADEAQLSADDLFGPSPGGVVGHGPAPPPASSLDSPVPEGIWGATSAAEETAQPEMAAQVESGEVMADGSASVAPTISEAFTVPDEVWGDAPELQGMAESVAAAEMQADDDWWVPRADAEDPVTTSVVPSPARRPKLAPPPSPVARSRRSGGLDIRKGVAAMALVVVAGAGLIMAMVSRGPNVGPTSAPQQIGAAGAGPTSTAPTTTIARPSTSVTAPATLEQPAPPTSGVPATSSAATPPPGPSGATPVTSAAPRSPTPTAAPSTAATSPPPAPASVPTPTATVAPPPPPTSVVVLPDPEPTVTTRRPRPTVPDTTIAPSTTVPTSRIPVIVE